MKFVFNEDNDKLSDPKGTLGVKDKPRILL
jgi:hypothetical protein